MALMPVSRAVAAVVVCFFVAPLAGGCDTPSTRVVLENGYPAAAADAFVVQRAFWQAVKFATPVSPGASTDPVKTVAASPNPAYVVVARGWDGDADAGAPLGVGVVVLQSRAGFEVHWNTTLHIVVDDTQFAGNCAVGSSLSQDDADFITGRVFAPDFAGRRYDAATCATTAAP